VAGQLSWTKGRFPSDFRGGAIIGLSRAAATQRCTNRPTPSQRRQKLHDKVNTQEGAKPEGARPLSGGGARGSAGGVVGESRES